MSEERFDRIDQRFDLVDQHLDRIEQRFGLVDQQFADVNRRLDDLDRHMHVLHEDVIATLAATKEYVGPTKGEMDERLADLKETTDRRLDPLEAVVRDHSARIGRLEKRRS